jgi:hypothetical protein
MADLVKFQFKGGHELDRVLYNMEKKAARNVLARTFRKTLNPVRDQIRKRIRDDLDTMDAVARAQYAKQIGVSGRVVRGGYKGYIRTSDKRVKTQHRNVKFSKLAHLFEDGVKPHKIIQPKRKRTINHPGITRRPIFAETFDSMASRLVVNFRDIMFQEIFSENSKVKK